MNVAKIIKELKDKYPGKFILLNTPENVREIVCEIEPTSAHRDYSTAVAVIDRSKPHYHQHITEDYKVLKGTLVLHIGKKVFTLHAGESTVIKPGNIHFAEGDETWIITTAHPGWTKEDHLYPK